MHRSILSLLILIGFSLLACNAKMNNKNGIEEELYGRLPNGHEVYKYTITNSAGSRISVTNYGAIITSIIVPNRDGIFDDVVLGYDSLQGYLNDRFYFGSIVGRYGNRIRKGQFNLDGKTYQLTLNDGENHLHGGKKGFNKMLWDAKIVGDSVQPAIELVYKSPDGEEGYPGNLTITVTYSFSDKNELRVDYKAETDKPTILNPTQHSYFNLSGSCSNTILDHFLMIEADSITPVDKGLIPTGRFAGVSNTPMDFLTPTAIGARINVSYEQLLFGNGYDHNWILRDYTGKVRKVAELYEPKSGRLLTVLTDRPGLQFYSGNFLDGTMRGKGGIAYQYRTGLCLEAQCFPDSPNKQNFPSVILKPGKVYHQTTIYQFSVK